MWEDRRAARILGVLNIIGTVAGVLSVVLTGPIRGSQDYLVSLPANRAEVTLGALLVLTMGLALALVPAAALRILREHDRGLALGFLVFRGALETVTYMVTVLTWLLLLNLSEAHGHGGRQGASGFQAVAAVLFEGEAVPP